MFLLIAPPVLAFILWCTTDTSLKHEHLQGAWTDGRITFWRTLFFVLVQIALWCLVLFFLGPQIIAHLPAFFSTSWRLGITFLLTNCLQWFAIFMVLQYAWLLERATLLTALFAFSPGFRERETRRKLERIGRLLNSDADCPKQS